MTVGTRGRLPVAVAAALAALAVSLTAGGAQAPAQSASVFSGLGTWVDIYDGALFATPERTADRIAARGVRTAWIETANYRAAVDVVRRRELGRLVDALHERGVRVVAWYLPGFDRPALDLRRTRAMLAFRTASGQAFDGVALDIEATKVKRIDVRNVRLLSLMRRLRAEAGSVPVAAITFPPRMLDRLPAVWPRFPWAEVAARSDALVPMIYTGSAFRGYEATYGYTARSLARLRALVGPDAVVHAAGGVADRLSEEEATAFADAVADDGGVAGWSLYDFATTPARGWRALEPLGR